MISIVSARTSMPSGAGNSIHVSWKKDAYRLIPSRFPPVSVYEGLVSQDQIDDVAKIEEITNPRLKSSDRLRTAGAGNPARLQNWNLAPFAYHNPEGSHFFGPEKPCLELAEDRQTALAVSVGKRQRFLERTSEPPIGMDMRMLKTPISGMRFADLRGMSPDLSQEERWNVGRNIPKGVDGVLYRPPERPNSVCIAVLLGTVLGVTVQTTHYRYEWDGQRISKLYAFDEHGTEIRPEDLAGTVDVLAA